MGGSGWESMAVVLRHLVANSVPASLIGISQLVTLAKVQMIRTGALLHFRWGKGVCEQKGPGRSAHEAEYRRPASKEQAHTASACGLTKIEPSKCLSHW